MFEGKLPEAHEARKPAAGEAPEEELCEVTWQDLVAKLAAARELRTELAHRDEGPLASFDADSARHLASHQEGPQEDNDEQGVNPVDLGNGKGTGGRQWERADRDNPAIRGNT